MAHGRRFVGAKVIVTSAGKRPDPDGRRRFAHIANDDLP